MCFTVRLDIPLCLCRDLDEAQAAADEARHEVVQADAAQAARTEHLLQELTRCMLFLAVCASPKRLACEARLLTLADVRCYGAPCCL